MKSPAACRTDRQLRVAYKAQLMADNVDLLALYADCLGMTCEALLQSMHPSERDLAEEDFADYLSNHAERLAA